MLEAVPAGHEDRHTPLYPQSPSGHTARHSLSWAYPVMQVVSHVVVVFSPNKVAKGQGLTQWPLVSA